MARGAPLDAIRAHGLTLVSPDDSRTVRLPAVLTAEELDPDVATTVLLGVKSHQTHAALEDLTAVLVQAGADIIVDDILYFAESPFQDGPIAQAVIDVTNDGALYFSSAGNEQNVDDRTAGNWEGDYVSSGRTVGKFAGIAHDFAPPVSRRASSWTPRSSYLRRRSSVPSRRKYEAACLNHLHRIG